MSHKNFELLYTKRDWSAGSQVKILWQITSDPKTIKINT